MSARAARIRGGTHRKGKDCVMLTKEECDAKVSELLAVLR